MHDKLSVVVKGIIVPATALSFLLIGQAQEEISKRMVGRARAIPISNRMITMKFTMSGGQWAQVTQRDGGLIRLAMNGVTVGVIPFFTEKDQVSAKILRIEKVIKDSRTVGESIEELEEVNIDQSFGAYTALASPLAFHVTVTEISQKVNPNTVEPIAEGGSSDCCVTCSNGLTACACRVSMSCGSCCVQPCC